MSSAYFFTALVVVLIPGTGVIYTLSVAFGRGWLASLFAALGCTLSILPHMLISMAGFAAFLHQSAILFSLLKYLGVAYLFYLAYDLYRSGQAIEVQASQNHKSNLLLVWDGVLLNLLNPKLTLFFMLFLPPFIDPNSAHLRLDMIMLVAVFMAQTFIVYLIYAAFAAALRQRVFANAKLMGRIYKGFAGILVFFGIRLALTENTA